jgi:transposase
MSKKEVVANRQYTDEFKVEAVRLGESIGGNQAANRLGVPESSLWNWMRLSRAGKLKAADGAETPVKRSVSNAPDGRHQLARHPAHGGPSIALTTITGPAHQFTQPRWVFIWSILRSSTTSLSTGKPCSRSPKNGSSGRMSKANKKALHFSRL